jgi:hypothetical protein
MMSYIYFVAPVMVPAESQVPPPLFYYPLRPANYTFPIPVMYGEPPIAVL